jgi:hypothetical protein
MCQAVFGATRLLNLDPLACRYRVTTSPFAAESVTSLPFDR